MNVKTCTFLMMLLGMLGCLGSVAAQEERLPADSLLATADTLQTETDTLWVKADTVAVQEQAPHKLSLIRRIIRGFDRIDERYIEPQHYLFTVMLQGTYTYDYFTLRTSGNKGHRISLAPDGTFKAGPYFGWKWLFAGYTIDLKHSVFNKDKIEWDFSLYSSQIGIDLFYRRTGADYKLRDVNLGDGISVNSLKDVSFDGVKAGITGVNVYYIFNHRHFSYPAAFSQSTCQKISCGSWMAGVGYMNNSLELDYAKLQSLVDEHMPSQQVVVDSAFRFSSLRYHDFNVSGGYAYNWVFCRNFLLCLGGQVSVGYNNISRSLSSDDFGSFSIGKVDVNFVGRFALVYNNTRWYAGLGAILRSNNRHESSFTANNTYGRMDMYVGYNFGLKKRYKNKKL